MAILHPNSFIFAAGANVVLPKKIVVPGRIVVITLLSARLYIPRSETAIKWSAENAPTSPANSFTPESEN